MLIDAAATHGGSAVNGRSLQLSTLLDFNFILKECGNFLRFVAWCRPDKHSKRLKMCSFRYSQHPKLGCGTGLFMLHIFLVWGWKSWSFTSKISHQLNQKSWCCVTLPSTAWWRCSKWLQNLKCLLIYTVINGFYINYLSKCNCKDLISCICSFHLFLNDVLMR